MEKSSRKHSEVTNQILEKVDISVSGDYYS